MVRAGKFVAFSGPQGATRYYCGFKAKQPEDYWQYFKRRGVSAVVRLNNKVCRRQLCAALQLDTAARQVSGTGTRSCVQPACSTRSCCSC